MRMSKFVPVLCIYTFHFEFIHCFDNKYLNLVFALAPPSIRPFSAGSRLTGQQNRAGGETHSAQYNDDIESRRL
jgi:hypothetical protein